jgi:hypothetical protein
MFGVLIVQTQEEGSSSIGYLAAFSGNLAGKNLHPYFVRVDNNFFHRLIVLWGLYILINGAKIGKINDMPPIYMTKALT